VSSGRLSSASRIVLGILFATPAGAVACDVCAIYTATEVSEGRTGFRAGIGGQWSHSTVERMNGEEIPPFGERLDSVITQFFLGYQLNERVGVQVNIPFIVRTFRRLEDGRLQDGDSIGAGDLSLIGNFLVFDRVTDRSVFLFSLLGGLKLPSGNPAFLGEELAPGPAGTAFRRGRTAHSTDDHGPEDPPGRQEGGIHGHDLALGSGSVDGIVGGSIYWSFDRFFVTAAMQYAARREGAFEYRYANDLTWVGGPGWYPLLTHEYTLGVQGVLSGETKGKDTQAGERLDDTALTSLYVGPGFRFTWGTQLSAEVVADYPIIQHNTELQTLPAFRLRGGFVWRF